MDRFIEVIDYEDILKAAGLVLEEEAGGSKKVLIPARGAENELDRLLAVQKPITQTFKRSATLERGFQLHHTANHVGPLSAWLLLSLGNVFLILGDAVLVPNVKEFLLILDLVVALSIVVAVFLYARGSPIRIKSIHHRAIFHEIFGLTIATLQQALWIFITIVANMTECRRVDRPGCFDNGYVNLLVSFQILATLAPRLKLTVFNFIVISAVNALFVIFGHQYLSSADVGLFIVAGVIGPVLGLQMTISWEAAKRETYKAALRLALKKVTSAALVRRASNVLEFLLPPAVLKPILDGSSVFHTHPATVIQADICNFTKWCGARNSDQVVQMLSVVVSDFDELALEEKVTRIKTLGDGYIAATGIPSPSSTHADSGLRFASSLQSSLSLCCTRNRDHGWGELKVRVGIHSGNTSAGVLSDQRWSYDIYGQVPQIAAILEPIAPPGGLLISEESILALTPEMREALPSTLLVPGPSFVIGAKTATTAADQTPPSEEDASHRHQTTGEIRTKFIEDPSVFVAQLTNNLQQRSSKPIVGGIGSVVGLEVEEMITVEDAVGGEEEEEGYPTEQNFSKRMIVDSDGGGGGRGGESRDGAAIGTKNRLLLFPADETSAAPAPSVLARARGTEGQNEPFSFGDEEANETQITRLHNYLLGAAGRSNFYVYVLALVLWLFYREELSPTVVVGVLLIVFQGIPLVTGSSFKRLLFATCLLTGFAAQAVISPLAISQGASLENFSDGYWSLVVPIAAVWPFPNEISAHAFFWISRLCRLINLALFANISSQQLLTQIFLWVAVSSLISLMRYHFASRLTRLRELNENQKTELQVLEKERKTLAVVLRLKMPQHVVEHLSGDQRSISATSSVVGDDLLKFVTTLPSTLVAFVRFSRPDLQESRGGGGSAEKIPLRLVELQRITAVLDMCLPSDGSGLNQHLEKVKSLGDSFLIAGSLKPRNYKSRRSADSGRLAMILSRHQEVATEEVLLEFLHMTQELRSNIVAASNSNQRPDDPKKNNEQQQQQQGEEDHNFICTIGVHVGEVTAATIGNANVEYDIFGTTVNTAARVLAAASSDTKARIVDMPSELPWATDEFVKSDGSFSVDSSERVQILSTKPVKELLERVKREEEEASMAASRSPAEGNLILPGKFDPEQRPDLQGVHSQYTIRTGPTFHAKGLGEMESYFLVSEPME